MLDLVCMRHQDVSHSEMTQRTRLCACLGIYVIANLKKEQSRSDDITVGYVAMYLCV
jgi:hypothetical protein